MSHRLEWPRAHDGHCPQAGMKPNTTWSPGARPVTPGPTSSTTPAPSWPPMIGNTPPRSPVTRCSSEWHMPEAASLTRTSPCLGRVELDRLDAPVGVELPQDGGFGLHRVLPDIT